MRMLMLTLFVCCVAGCSDEELSKPATPDELEKSALQMISNHHGIALKDLQVVSSVTGRYPAMGKVTSEYKIVNGIDGTIHGVALDETGQEIDAAKLQQSELAARELLERRLDAPLAARLTSAKSDELIEIAIWLKEPPYQAPARPAPHSNLTSSQSDELLAQVSARRSAFLKTVVDPFAARLRNRGFQVKADTHAPLIYATLSPDVIEELRVSKDVDRMYLPVVAEPTLLPERQAIFAHVVNNLGFNGAGVRVAAVEVGGIINTVNPFLSGVTQDSLFSCASNHADAVAGIIRSTHTPEMGVASGANLWVGGSCGGISSELENRSTAAVDWGARALNLSFGASTGGAITTLDRYYDDLIINRFRTVVVAAGNSGNAGFVLSPGSAYNAITVGAYDELPSPNLIANFSSGRDPISSHSDREKPEVAAPGVNFVSTISATPWIGNVGSGTSYAAPMTAGTVALMMQRDPSLQSWPEGVRAILMATASDNIEGASRLSELDGAGGIRASSADDVSRGVVTGTWDGIGYNCNAAPVTVLGTISLPALNRHRVRVVISYDTDPAYASYSSQPSADLDLTVRGPGITASSASFDNTYEIVEFTTNTFGGNYTIEVSKFRCDVSPRWLAFAYKADALITPIPSEEGHEDKLAR